MLRICLEMAVAALLLTGSLADAARAQTQGKDNTLPPSANAPVLPTPQNRSGLPPAPPEVVPPGSAARPFTGNDATQPPGQIMIVPRDRGK